MPKKPLITEENAVEEKVEQEPVEEVVEETVSEEKSSESASEETVEEIVKEMTEEEETSEETESESDGKDVSEGNEESEKESSDAVEEAVEESDEESDSEEDSSEEEKEESPKAAAKKKRRSRKHADDEELDEEELAKEKSSLYMFLDTVRFVAVGLLVGILLVVFVIQRNDVYGTSMEPTLQSGDAVFVQMLSVYMGNFNRGDIVTIDAKGMEGYTHEENLIKRVVGLPGETIKIEDGNVYINGNLLDESAYLPSETRTYVGAEGQARGYMELTLGPDEYYCMGDNRSTSKDSRRLGPFKKSQLESKVLMRIYPFNKIKFF